MERICPSTSTAAELSSQNTASPTYAPDSKYVQLWLDFDNLADAPEEVTDPENETVYGDANCDGGIDMSDAVLIMQSLANPNKYGIKGSNEKHITEQGQINGDVDTSIKGITSNDALRIQEYLLGIVKSLEP